jgi:hypothetical protein
MGNRCRAPPQHLRSNKADGSSDDTLNWLLGVVNYYLVPSLGPAFVAPHLFSDLPRTDVTRLQSYLAETRFEVLRDPAGADALAGVAGFASLHVSVVFTAALIAHRVGLPLILRGALWSFLVLTVVATAYFGWHYVVDDVAGLLLGWLAVRWRTGPPAPPPRQRRSAPDRGPRGCCSCSGDIGGTAAAELGRRTATPACLVIGVVVVPGCRGASLTMASSVGVACASVGTSALPAPRPPWAGGATGRAGAGTALPTSPVVDSVVVVGHRADVVLGPEGCGDPFVGACTAGPVEGGGARPRPVERAPAAPSRAGEHHDREDGQDHGRPGRSTSTPKDAACGQRRDDAVHADHEAEPGPTIATTAGTLGHVSGPRSAHRAAGRAGLPAGWTVRSVRSCLPPRSATAPPNAVAYSPRYRPGS